MASDEHDTPTISATGPNGKLEWRDGQWTGDPELTGEAEIWTDSNHPLPSADGKHEIAFQDGELLYAAAVMCWLIGSPVEWETPLPDNAHDKLPAETRTR